MVVSRRRVLNHKPVRYVLNTLRIEIVYIYVFFYTGMLLKLPSTVPHTRCARLIYCFMRGIYACLEEPYR